MNYATHTCNGSVKSADIKDSVIIFYLLRQHMWAVYVKKGLNISIRIQTTQAHTAVNSEEIQLRSEEFLVLTFSYAYHQVILTLCKYSTSERSSRGELQATSRQRSQDMGLASSFYTAGPFH